MNLIFSLLLIGLQASADLTFVDVDKISPTTTVSDQAIEAEFAKFKVFKTSEITIERSGMIKADLIAAWRQETGSEDIDSFYYRKNRVAYHKIDEEFKAVYESISPSVTEQLVQNLSYEGVKLKAGVSSSSFTLKNGTRPAMYIYKGKRVMLVMTVLAVCVVNNEVVRTEAPLKLYSKLKCPGGHTEWMTQFNGLEYKPLCKGKPCLGDAAPETSVTSYLIGAKLVSLPDTRRAPVVHALESAQ